MHDSPVDIYNIYIYFICIYIYIYIYTIVSEYCIYVKQNVKLELLKLYSATKVISSPCFAVKNVKGSV